MTADALRGTVPDVDVGCPRCGGPLQPPGLFSSDWRCDTHGAVSPLHAPAAPVHEADLAPARLEGRVEVVGDDLRNVAWREGVQVERVFDGHPHRIVAGLVAVHVASSLTILHRADEIRTQRPSSGPADGPQAAAPRRIPVVEASFLHSAARHARHRQGYIACYERIRGVSVE